MVKQKVEPQSQFMALYQGYLQGIMKWTDFDDLMRVLKDPHDKQWFVYHVGDDLPTQVTSQEQFELFINEIDVLFKKEHEEDYCGIVYANNPKDPQLVKFYDPNNLGVVCGFSDNPPLPGWVISTTKPEDLELAFPPVGARKRWWKRIFS